MQIGFYDLQLLPLNFKLHLPGSGPHQPDLPHNQVEDNEDAKEDCKGQGRIIQKFPCHKSSQVPVFPAI